MLEQQDIGFLEHVLARAGKDWHVTQLASLHEHLLTRLGKGGSLPEVTVALLLGDLSPFMSSSFRYTHWNPCLRWLQSDHGRVFNVDPEQRAMLQILGVIGQLSTLGDADPHPLQRAIDRIPSSNGTAKMLALLRARYRTALKEGRGTLDRWRSLNEREPDADIRLETLVRIASAYQLAGLPRLTFDCLFAAYDRRRDASPSTQGLVLYSALATVNRRHVLGLRNGIGRNANEFISEAATELGSLAVGDENVVSLANALFYRCRGTIQAKAGSAPRESLDHLPTLTFVERVAPMRRLQALLTQASVSRHICSNGAPSWPEYRERAIHASLCLRRAHASAGNRLSGHRHSSTHILNATSYQLEVFSCASRYAAEPMARRELPGLAATAAQMTEETLEALKVIRMLPGDELAILPAVKLLYPLAAVLRECKYSDWAASADQRLRQPLEEMLAVFQGMLEEPADERGTAARKALQAYVHLLEALRLLGAMRQAEAAGVLSAMLSMGRCVLEGKRSPDLEPIARQLMDRAQETTLPQ